MKSLIFGTLLLYQSPENQMTSWDDGQSQRTLRSWGIQTTQYQLPSRNPIKSSKPAGVGPESGHLTFLGGKHASWACYKNPVYRDRGLSLQETGQRFGSSLQKEKLLPPWSSLAEASTRHPLPCNLPSPSLTPAPFLRHLLLEAVTFWLAYVSARRWLIWPLSSLCGAHPSFPLLPRASSPKLMHTDSSLRAQQPQLMWTTASKLRCFLFLSLLYCDGAYIQKWHPF